MIDGNTGSVHATNGWIIAAVSALGNTADLNTRAGVGTVLITVIAIIWSMAAWMGIGISDKMFSTLAGVASGSVLTNSRHVTRMSTAFVHIHTAESALILESSSTSTGGQSITNDAGSMSATIDVIASIFADKVDTLSVERTVSIF